MYTVSQAAKALDLHPKTVRRFIRDGRIRAHKIGREWRIHREDLREYAHGELADRPAEAVSTVRLGDRIHVSAVIALEEGNSEEVSRISNTLLAVLNGKDPSWGESRYDLIFHPESGKARFVLYGSPRFIQALLECVEVLTAPAEGSAPDSAPTEGRS